MAEKKKVPLSVRLDESLHSFLAKDAIRNRRNMTNNINVILFDYKAKVEARIKSQSKTK